MPITPYLLYEDCEAALDFLARAFGFEETLRYKGAEGYVNHAEMSLGDGHLYMGCPGDGYENPAKRGGATVLVMVPVEDVDATFERARDAGAQITEEPSDQDYGERRFGATDPEGHKWFFSQRTSEVGPEEWGATTPA